MEKFTVGLHLHGGMCLDGGRHRGSLTALPGSEETLRAFFRSEPVAVAMFDRELRYLAYSHRWMTELGLGDEDLTGRSLNDARPELPDDWEAGCRRSLEGESTGVREVRVERGDGSARWLRWQVRPWYSDDGTVGGIVVVAEDITSLTASMERLRNSDARLRAFTTVALDVIYCMNPDWTEMQFLRGREFIADTHAPNGDWLTRYIPPDDQQTVMDAVHQAIRTASLFELEHRIIRVDGTLGWTHSRAVPIFDAQGEIIEWFGAALDITPMREVLAALQERESRLRAILNTVVDAIVTIDQRGIITSANAATERMFGYSQADLVGENVRILMPQPYRDEHDRYISRYQRTGEARIIGIGREVLGRRKDGSTLAIDVAVTEVDQLDCFVGVIRDITSRKDAEAQLRQADRLSSIGTLAAGLGHDMSNVLLPVRSRLDIVERAELAPRFHEHLAAIRKSMEYLRDLADNLHLLALDPQETDGRAETIDLQEWWQHARSLLRRAIPTGIRFDESIETDLPGIAVSLPRLTQAVLNLLVNASRAVGDNGRVELWARASSDATVVLGVTDNGSGMTTDVKRRALEPFFTTKTRGMGTGLGLALVHGVVRSAGGSVEIESAPGEGTTVMLEFPCARSRATDADSLVDVRPLARVTAHDKRLESLIAAVLEAAGFRVDADAEVPTPKTALWITEPCAEVRDLLVSDSQGCCPRVLVLGPPPDDWPDVDCTIVANPSRFDDLRAAIDQAVGEVLP